ncbi:FMN-linked oxidoreductase [Whalleya microplaca]|nr:FMN-linked oxidoreductase [Whalleya microplaca]
MDTELEDADLQPRVHPLKLFDLAASQQRYLYACAPMVRYSKLAFRQTVHHFGTDLCWTPMILAKEFNRSAVARDSDLTISTSTTTSSIPEPPTIAQFGSNSPAELARAASLAAPAVNGVDLNCGCPQSWACAETLGAALMERRELVRDMVVAARSRLASDGWAVGLEASKEEPRKGRSVSVKIRVHRDLRRTMDFITTVLGEGGSGEGTGGRNIDWLTIHPRTRSTPSSTPIDMEALEVLTETFGDRVPILVSGDVFTLASLPYTSHLLSPQPTFTTSSSSNNTNNNSSSSPAEPLPTGQPLRHLPKLRGLMSARALLANPALFAGHETCPWAAVDVFMSRAARAPLPLKLAVHHLSEMCGPGFGPDRSALLGKRDRVRLNELGNWVDVVDFMDEVRGERGGVVRLA